MLQLRRILLSVLCFSLCLTVFAVPVFANLSSAKQYIYNGYLSAPVDLFSYSNNSGNVIYPFNGHISSVFTLDNISSYGILDIRGSSLGSLYGYKPGTSAGYFEIVFNVLEPLTLVTSADTGGLVVGCVSSSGGSISFPSFGKSDFFYDGNVVNLALSGSSTFDMVSGSWPVYRYFGWRFYYDDYVSKSGIGGTSDFSPFITFHCNSAFSSLGGLNGDSALLGSIDISNGLLKDIDSNIVDVKNTITVIDSNLSDIKDVVTDTNQQLQNDNSSIWSAFGNKVSSTLEGLFVPSQQDIEDVKDGFDELAKDKLGGAYTAVETVDNAVSDISMKLNNPSASNGIEFPGISVPLGGDVGTVTLAEAQTVTLPTELTAILHPVAGTIIAIVCGLGTLNVLKDMADCFLSGFSYAEYLHRNKGGSDE